MIAIGYDEIYLPTNTNVLSRKAFGQWIADTLVFKNVRTHPQKGVEIRDLR